MTRVRKQIYDLTETDLLNLPVWEYALDEEGDEVDEATVRPVKYRGTLDTAKRNYIVRASFVLADGSTFLGYLTTPLDDPEDLSRIQPQIVTSEGQVPFWFGTLKCSRNHIKSLYATLGKTSRQVFPIQFRSDVSLKSGPVSGAIDGFLAYANWPKSEKITASR